MFVREMSHHECSSLVGASHLARLACCVDNDPYVVPIYYAMAGNCLYSFSMPGKKIEWMRTNPKVCVLVEEMASLRQWRSVVIHGHFQELSPEGQWHREYLHAWSLLEKHTNWWEPGGLKPTTPEIASGYKHVFYSIDIATMTGRQAGDQDEYSLPSSRVGSG